MQKVGDIYVLIFAGLVGGMLLFAVSFVLMHFKNQNKFLRQKEKEQKLQIEHQQELLHTVISSQETERKRIGQDLHDDVGTALSNLRLTIGLFSQNPQIGFTQFSSNCNSIIDRIIQDVRHISHNLSPPGIEMYGFLGALEELCDSMVQLRSVKINIQNDAESMLDQLDTLKCISLYRVMEELLNNTIKHANATIIDIHFMQKDHHLHVIYKDNGIGLSANMKSKKGMGLHNIESRLEMIGAVIILPTISYLGYQCQFKLKI